MTDVNTLQDEIRRYGDMIEQSKVELAKVKADTHEEKTALYKQISDLSDENLTLKKENDDLRDVLAEDKKILKAPRTTEDDLKELESKKAQAKAASQEVFKKTLEVQALRKKLYDVGQTMISIAQTKPVFTAPEKQDEGAAEAVETVEGSAATETVADTEVAAEVPVEAVETQAAPAQPTA